MPLDDSTESTDLIDVMRGALAAPWLRVITVWLASAAGTVLGLTLHQICLMARAQWYPSDYFEWDADYDFWLVSFGAPLSFVGSIGELDHAGNADPTRWPVLILSYAAVFVWLRATIRVCAGRWLATSVCHLFAASSLIATGRMGGFWWVAVGLAAIMVIAWYWRDGFREMRAAEADYERDGI